MAQSFQLIRLSDRAAEQLRMLLSDQDEVSFLRIGVKNAGCAGMAYTMDYVTEPVSGDDKVVEKGVEIYIDPKASLFLLGTQMDYETSKLKSGFVFNNPNEQGACGCGESVNLAPADLQELARARASKTN